MLLNCCSLLVDDKPWCKVPPIFISLWIIYVRHVQCSYQNNRKGDWGRASSEIWGRETAEQNSVSVMIKNKQKTLVRLCKAHQAFFKTFISADRKHIHLWTSSGPSSLGRCECLGAGKVIWKGCASLSKPTERLWLLKAIKTLKHPDHWSDPEERLQTVFIGLGITGHAHVECRTGHAHLGAGQATTTHWADRPCPLGWLKAARRRRVCTRIC